MKDEIPLGYIQDYFLKDVVDDISSHEGISASVIDIAEYNRLARVRGFKNIDSDYDVAYLLYTHRGIHKSLIYNKKRHIARWATVKSVVDQILEQRELGIDTREDGTEDAIASIKYDYQCIPLHDLTTNAYDEIQKLELYMDFRKGSPRKTEQYDVMSLANSTADFAILGYEAQNSGGTHKTVLVHRSRGCWVQITTLVTVKIRTIRNLPTFYTISKDMQPFKSCYDALGAKVANIGFYHQDWRDVCVDPEILDTQVRLTFEDYMWEFYNMWIPDLHPYQQSALILLSGALRSALYSEHSEEQLIAINNKSMEPFTSDPLIGPYLLLVKRMFAPTTFSNKFTESALNNLQVSRGDYILGIWLAYVSAVKLLIHELANVNLEDYVQSVSSGSMITRGQRKVIIGLVIITAFMCSWAIGMIIVRCSRRHNVFFSQRQQNILFYTMSSTAYEETDSGSNNAEVSFDSTETDVESQRNVKPV
uniref:Uncharacterized protein n=2 Tax=Babesia bovis TaxID=5865 RepID=A7ASE1_BABBO|eukprot:XP_001611028.1 hypothetical protein [Babesia bovis T2Bo]